LLTTLIGIYLIGLQVAAIIGVHQLGWMKALAALILPVLVPRLWLSASWSSFEHCKSPPALHSGVGPGAQALHADGGCHAHQGYWKNYQDFAACFQYGDFGLLRL
jgi:hypothetical protein